MLTAMVYGQGNVRTFDNEDYYVCGEGDFILLQSSPVTIEGRFQRSPFNRKFSFKEAGWSTKYLSYLP